MYFSAYGNGGYDSNDVNFWTEADANNSNPIWLQFFSEDESELSRVAGTQSVHARRHHPVTANGTVTYEKAQTFQIFSPGVDGLYGVGGQFVAPGSANSTASNSLPIDAGQHVFGYAAGGVTDY